MVKKYDSDVNESNVQYQLPVEKFDFQALSKKMALRVCRFDGTTFLYTPELTVGKPYEEVYYLAEINGEKKVQRVDYAFLATIRTFLKEQKDAGKSTILADYKLRIEVTRTPNGQYMNSDYEVVKSKDVANANVEEGDTELEAALTDLESYYQGNTDRFLSKTPAAETTEDKPKADKPATPKAKKEAAPVKGKKTAPVEDLDEDDDDIPF